MSLADTIYQKSLELPTDKAIEVIDFIDFIQTRLDSETDSGKKRLNARELLASNLIGLWKDRLDISDSAQYARQLRNQAQRRG